MENYPYATETTQFMAALSEDLGCVKMVKVERSELASTQWNHGVVFVWETITGGGCWSALGQVSGYTGGSTTSIASITDVSFFFFSSKIRIDQVWSSSRLANHFNGG